MLASGVRFVQAINRTYFCSCSCRRFRGFIYAISPWLGTTQPKRWFYFGRAAGRNRDHRHFEWHCCCRRFKPPAKPLAAHNARTISSKCRWRACCTLTHTSSYPPAAGEILIRQTPTAAMAARSQEVGLTTFLRTSKSKLCETLAKDNWLPPQRFKRHPSSCTKRRWLHLCAHPVVP